MPDPDVTLDPRNRIPDDALPTAGQSEEEAKRAKERADAHYAQLDAEVQAQAERDREWAERDPKPTPSQFMAESGREPVPESDEPKPKASKGERKKGD